MVNLNYSFDIINLKPIDYNNYDHIKLLIYNKINSTILNINIDDNLKKQLETSSKTQYKKLYKTN